MTSVGGPVSMTTTTQSRSPPPLAFKSAPPSLPPVLAAPPATVSANESTPSDAPRRPMRLVQKTTSDTPSTAAADTASSAPPSAAVKGPLRRIASVRLPPPRTNGWSSSSRDGSVSDGDPPMLSINPVKPPMIYTGLKDPETLLRSTLPPASESAARRGYDELEEITFQNPASFKAMVFAIAASRGNSLRVSDDRTHKVTSAYMHITCDYRGSGCPFILKLTKAKEGGWVLKSAKAPEIDPKQRSNYRCRHPAGAKPDPPLGLGTSLSLLSSTSHPGPPGSKPKAAKPKPKPATDMQPKPAAGSAPRRDETSSDPISRERTLASPFARSMSTQITPALASAAGPQRTRGTSVTNIKPSLQHQRPQAAASSAAAPLSLQSLSTIALPALPPASNIAPSYHAPVRPDSLVKWRDVLTRIDAELVPLADILASPQVDAHPASFFRESNRLQQLLLDTLDVPAWLKVKLKEKISKQGRAAWGDVENGRRAPLPQLPVSPEPSVGHVDSSYEDRDVAMDDAEASSATAAGSASSQGGMSEPSESPTVASPNGSAASLLKSPVLDDHDKGKGRLAPPSPHASTSFIPPPPRPAFHALAREP